MKQQGRITKIISNQYTIHDHDKSLIAVPRGKLRLSQAPVVGDLVEYENDNDTPRILRIFPRKNRLLRPSVANVDQALIVTSCKDPDFSDHLLNRLIFLVSMEDVEPVICITKYDMLTDTEKAQLQQVLNRYRQAGYTVVFTYPGSNDEELRQVLDGKISVLCGQSGAGKSSLLNRLEPSFQLHTQKISKALGRGKHTTRHCELHQAGGGLVADTPGFSSLEFSRLDVEHLDEKIRDFQPYLHQCRFKDCRHLKEPGCNIKEAVEAEKINPSVYEDYKQIMEEFVSRKKY